MKINANLTRIFIFDIRFFVHICFLNQIFSLCYLLNFKHTFYIVDVKIQNQKIFVLITLYDTCSKNSFASYFENIEISIAMNMSFLEYFINENNFVIEIFNFDIKLRAFSKNSSLQHIENSKTLKKNYVYDFFAFFVFEFNIDIDFEIYTIDSKIIYSNIQFLITLFISFISSITLQINEKISNYEKK